VVEVVETVVEKVDSEVEKGVALKVLNQRRFL
jgi:hypothetical protein